MTNKKHPQPKVKPPKRLYYRLSEAARELTKYFGEEITEDDLVHWGAIKYTKLLVPITKNGGVNWDRLETAFTVKDLVFALFGKSDFGAQLWFVESEPQFGELKYFDCQALEIRNVISNGYIDFYRWFRANPSYTSLIDMPLLLSIRAPFDGKRASLIFSGVNITKADLFISAEEVERIKRGEEPDRLPEEEQNSMAKLMRQPRPQRMRTEHALIAALLADRTKTSAKDLEKAARAVGAEISDDTIRDILKQVAKVAHSLPNFET